jgi:hypothetical protein
MAQRAARWREAQVAEARGEDDAVARVLDERRPVIGLPERVRGVWVDPDGRAWLKVEAGSDPVAEMRDSMERAVSGRQGGQGRVIRGGLPVLRDSRGRVWVVGYASGGRYVVGYDGKQWYERRAADPAPPGATQWGWMNEQAWEDAAGNVIFVGSDPARGVGVHRLTADGRWEYQNLVAAADLRAAEHRFLDGELLYAVRQPGGRMTLCGSRPLSGAGELRAVHFDGARWAVIAPGVCRSDVHSVSAAFALADGSVGSICSAGRLWTHWPASTPLDDRAVATLVGRLDAADAGARDRATNELVALGAKVRGRLEAALDEGLTPEATVRVRAVLASIAATERHGMGVLYGGRFTFGRCEVVNRARDGRTTLLARDVEDLSARRRHEAALLVVGADGAWDVRPVPIRQWRTAGWSRAPQDCFEDRAGRLYVEPGLRTNAKGELERVTDLGVAADRVLGEDAAGRLYVRGRGGLFVLDEAAPAARPDLPVARHEMLGFGGFPGDGTAVGLYVGKARPALSRFRGGRWEGVPEVAGRGEVSVFFPLAAGAAVVRFGVGEACLFDGTAVHEADGLWPLVRDNAARLAKLAGRGIEPTDGTRLAVDDRGHLSFSRVEYESAAGDPVAQRLANRLMHYDGARWRDAWAETGWKPPVTDAVVALADGGRTMLVRMIPAGELRRIWFDGERLRGEAVPAPAGFAIVTPDLVASPAAGTAGRVWMTSGTWVFAYADGRVTEWPSEGRPMFADSRGRLWTENWGANPIRVQDASGAVVAEGMVGGHVSAARMVESPDGRLLLVHAEGVSELGVEETAAGSAPGAGRAGGEPVVVGDAAERVLAGVLRCGERALDEGGGESVRAVRVAGEGAVRCGKGSDRGGQESGCGRRRCRCG